MVLHLFYIGVTASGFDLLQCSKNYTIKYVSTYRTLIVTVI